MRHMLMGCTCMGNQPKWSTTSDITRAAVTVMPNECARAYTIHQRQPGEHLHSANQTAENGPPWHALQIARRRQRVRPNQEDTHEEERDQREDTAKASQGLTRDLLS